MKRLCILFLLFPIFAFSQNEDFSLFSGGAEISLVASQIDGDLQTGYHKISPGFGVYTDLNLYKKLKLRSGVYYAPKGARSGSNTNFFVTSFNYVEIPLYATYKFDKKFSASLGLLFDIMANGYYYDGVTKTSYKELNIRTMDFAHYWSFNIAVSKKMTLRFVQNYSLIPISKDLSRTCWRNNMFFYWMFKNVPPQPCWWNNVLKISLDIKLTK